MPCKPLSCVCGSKYFLPMRYVAAILAFFSIIVAYGQRVVFNIIITTMIVHEKTNNPECPARRKNDTSEAIQGGLQHWSETQQQIILASFFLGYVIMHVPAGIVSDRLGARVALGYGSLISTIATGLFSLTVNYTPWYCVAIMRIIVGLAQSVVYPGISTLYAHWIPKEERSLIGSLSFAGNAVGLLCGNFFSGYCVHLTRDWRSAYYMWTIIGVIWCMIFFLYVYSEPNTHPRITDAELERLQENIRHSTKLKIPWAKIMSCGGVWAILITQLGHDYTIFTMMTNIPKYLSDVLNYEVRETAMLTSFPFVTQWIGGILAGKLCDWLHIRKGVDLLLLRNICTFVGLTIPPAILMVAAYMNCDGIMVGVFFGVSLFLKGAFYAGAKVNHLDLSVNFAGMVMAITNACGAIMGFVGPYIILFLAPDNKLKQWRHVFWFIFGFSAFTNVFYIFFAKAHRMKWDVPDYELEQWTKEKDEHRAQVALAKQAKADKDQRKKEEKQKAK